MSYCRWSSDDYQCDIYAYESEDGFVVHVATNRRTPDEPFPEPVSYHEAGFEAWMDRERRVVEMMKASPSKLLNLPHDGESSSFDTAVECAIELERLKGCGYNVPQYAIDALREEADG